MKILITGVTGFIGSALCGYLASEGHQITGVARNGSSPVPQAVTRLVRLDMSRAASDEDWLPHLQDIDVVINCAGTLQDNGRENTTGVHVTGAEALFRACEQAGVRRVIHFSALGVGTQQPSAFSETKHQGDEKLRQRDLNWVILQPSVVLGQRVFGAAALIRGLAALPVLPVMPDTGPLQVVQLNDVIATVKRFLEPDAPSRVTIELAGPERLSMEAVIAAYRAWLGWRPARRVKLPEALAVLLYRLGDVAGWFGWRPPLRTTARKEIVRGATGEPQTWTELTGIRPRSLEVALTAHPAGVQERWFARTYFLKPLIFVVLPVFWMATGIISLTSGWERGVSLMWVGGAGALSAPSVVAGALSDMAVGMAITFRRSARWGLYAAIALSIFYAITGSFVRPDLWSDPLGPFLKIFPIIAAHLFALAVLEER